MSTKYTYIEVSQNCAESLELYNTLISSDFYPSAIAPHITPPEQCEKLICILNFTEPEYQLF